MSIIAFKDLYCLDEAINSIRRGMSAPLASVRGTWAFTDGPYKALSYSRFLHRTQKEIMLQVNIFAKLDQESHFQQDESLKWLK